MRGRPRAALDRQRRRAAGAAAAPSPGALRRVPRPRGAVADQRNRARPRLPVLPSAGLKDTILGALGEVAAGRRGRGRAAFRRAVARPPAWRPRARRQAGDRRRAGRRVGGGAVVVEQIATGPPRSAVRRRRTRDELRLVGTRRRPSCAPARTRRAGPQATTRARPARRSARPPPNVPPRARGGPARGQAAPRRGPRAGRATRAAGLLQGVAAREQRKQGGDFSGSPSSALRHQGAAQGHAPRAGQRRHATLCHRRAARRRRSGRSGRRPPSRPRLSPPRADARQQQRRRWQGPQGRRDRPLSLQPSTGLRVMTR